MSPENTVTAEDLANLDQDESGFTSAQPEYMTPGKNLHQGEPVTGIYMGTSPSKFDGVNHKINTKSGVRIFNGCGSLNSQIEAAGIKVGDTVRITYEGKKTLTDGKWKGKDCHQYTLKFKRA